MDVGLFASKGASAMTMLFGLEKGLSINTWEGVCISEDAEVLDMDDSEAMALIRLAARVYYPLAQDVQALEYARSNDLGETPIPAWATRRLADENLEQALSRIPGNPFADEEQKALAALILERVRNAIHRDKSRRSAKPNLRGQVIDRDRSTCRYCGEALAPGLVRIDHVIPYSLGGLTELDNLVVACQRCNQQKLARTPEQAEMVLREVE